MTPLPHRKKQKVKFLFREWGRVETRGILLVHTTGADLLRTSHKPPSPPQGEERKHGHFRFFRGSVMGVCCMVWIEISIYIYIYLYILGKIHALLPNSYMELTIFIHPTVGQSGRSTARKASGFPQLNRNHSSSGCKYKNICLSSLWMPVYSAVPSCFLRFLFSHIWCMVTWLM